MAQTRPVRGDVERNIEAHRGFIDQALARGTDLIVFPELSLTGYEPTLAKELATSLDDRRFDVFQAISTTRRIAIGAGMPTVNGAGICISMLLFQPDNARRVYSKKYIHADEEPFFVSGANFPRLEIRETPLSLAICYELSVPAHAEAAFESGAAYYVASVAKSVSGIDRAAERLAEIARTYSMTVLMANCVGWADGEACAGRSAVWDTTGAVIGRLNGTDEGLLLYDTDTREVIEETM